jgi:hypothetical protein
MKNINSGKELFSGKENYFDYRTHHLMPKIKYGKRRGRKRYMGIVNQAPPKSDAIQQNLTP